MAAAAWTGAETGSWIEGATSRLLFCDSLIGAYNVAGFCASLETAGAGLGIGDPDSSRKLDRDGCGEHCEGSLVTKLSLFSSDGVRGKMELGSCDGATGKTSLVNLGNPQLDNAVTVSSTLEMKEVRLDSRVAHWVAM